MYTVVNKSTSYNWVMNKIKSTFKLDTKGLGFLAGGDIKIDFGEDGQTYQQGFQAIKEFYCSSLLKKGAKYRGAVMEKNEPLTPLSENMIVEKWLDMIDQRLRNHIMQTRGHLFTDERPNLFDNQTQLCEQMETMLQELGHKDGPGINRAGFSFQGGTRRGLSQTAMRGRQPKGGFGMPSRASSGPAGRPNSRGSCPPDTCIRCYEAGRFGPASRTHFARDCTYPPNHRPNQPMKILLIPASSSNHNQQNPTQVQEIQIQPNLLDQAQPGYQEFRQEEVQQDFDYRHGEEEEIYDPNFNYQFENKDAYYYDGLYMPKTEEPKPTINLIPTRTIQKFTFLCQGKQAIIAIDSGCEGDCMSKSEACRLGIKILPLDKADKIPNQADGQSPLNALGAVKTTFVRDGLQLSFHGYVIQNLSQPILCGTPFISRNKIVQIIHKQLMMVGDKAILEDPPFYPGGNLPFTIQDINLPKTTFLPLIEIGSKVPQRIKDELNKVHMHHKKVFDGDLSTGYNGVSGDFDVDFDFNNDLPPPAHKGSTPSYYKQEDEQVLQAKIEELERQNVVAKVSNLGINIKYASPCMLTRKTSAKQMSKDEYSKLSVEEKAKLNRFVLCLNKLCDFVNKKPALSSKIEDTINKVGSFEFVITADLQDSFNQRRIRDYRLPYMGFHSPFGDNYVFLRSPQGLINQSEELETLVKVVLLDGVKAGHVKVHADNIYVMGHTYKETVARWEKVLDCLGNNNLKLSPKKTACFPDKLDLLGWTKEGKFLIPDPHRQNTLITAPKPTNIREMRSFLGTYHTFYKSQPKQNMLLAPLTKSIANNPPPGQKIAWTPDLIQAFQRAQEEANKIDKLYVPKPEDQLALTSDYAEKGTNMKAGICATLWAMVGEDWHVVARMSAELQPQQINLYPCDGEAAAVFVAAKSPAFRVPIKAARKRTLALVDSKPLMEAAKLLNNGKFSSSRIINNVLTSISELNLEFHHISGKMGKNCPDDFGSRSPTACTDPENCKIHAFIKECTTMTVSTINLSVSISMGAIVGQVQKQEGILQDILAGKTRLPLDNKQAMIFLQSRDNDLRRVKELLLAGQRPSEKRDKKTVKVFFRSDVNTSIDKDGCIVVIKRSRKSLVTRTLLVIPNPISMGLLYSLHINLDHPTKDQLHQAVDTRFYVQELANKCQAVVDSCTLCNSTNTIPMEVHNYKANTVPDHPGKSFTVDVLRDCSKFVLVATDNFSGFISTAFITSETSEELRNGIIKTITPFMASSLNRIRVDRAPGFAKLSTQTKLLADIGIDVELGDAKNKNALAIVDQKIKELRSAIKKISPSSKILNQLSLAKATTSVNECIRHHKLSAKEIQFSRDLASSKNLNLVDEDIAEKIANHRTANNPASARAKSVKKTPAQSAEASVGQLVFIKHEGDKSSRRDLYLVIETDPEDKNVTLCKVRDALSKKPASIVPHDPRYRYRVSQEDLVLAPNQPSVTTHQMIDAELHQTEDWQGGEEQDLDWVSTRKQPLAPQDEELEEEEIWFSACDTSEELRQEAEAVQVPEEEQSAENISQQEGQGQNEVPGEGQQQQEVQGLGAIEQEPPQEVQGAEGGQWPGPEEELEQQLAENTDEEVFHNHQQGDDQGYVADNEDYFQHVDREASEEVLPLDQTRLPVKGDIIAYWDNINSHWVTAKIANKVQGYKHYYNIELEDGRTDGLYCRPPKHRLYQVPWTLLDPDEWNPLNMEQLLHLPPDIPSRQITPETTPHPLRVADTPDYHHWQQSDGLDLALAADQEIQEGRVHVLPDYQVRPYNTLQEGPVEDEKYNNRVQQIARELQLPPEQEYLRVGQARFLAWSEQYKKRHSTLSKIKKSLGFGKQ